LVTFFFLALLGLSRLNLSLSWLLVGLSWLLLGLSWLILGLSYLFMGSFGAPLDSCWVSPVPAVPHLEPPLSRHKDSLASSWSLSWPIRVPPPLIFPSAVASGCMINSDPSWRFRLWTHVKPPVPHIGGSHETVALPRIILGFLSLFSGFLFTRTDKVSTVSVSLEHSSSSLPLRLAFMIMLHLSGALPACTGRNRFTGAWMYLKNKACSSNYSKLKRGPARWLSTPRTPISFTGV